MVVSVPNEINTRNINIDERAKDGVKVIKRIGDSIHEFIVLEADCPANNNDKEITELGPKSMIGSEK